MNKLFNLKRTKMIDEAAYNHKPTSMLKCILIFLLVFIISNVVQGIIVGIPTAIYTLSEILSNDEFTSLMSAFADGEISQDVFIEEYTKFLESFILNLPSWLTLISLFATVAIIIASIVYCTKIEKRPLSSMGIRKGRGVSEYLLGLLVGAILFGLSYLVVFLTGAVEISFQGFSPMIILFLLAFIIQGASEELLVRGYLMVSNARDYSVAISIGMSALMFGMLHLFNSGFSIIAFLNIIIFGIFLGVYVYKRGDLFGACAIHTIWNFLQGNIFGVNVSGIAGMPSLCLSTYTDGKDIISGGAFGLEGGIAVTIVLIVAILLLLLTKQRASEVSAYESEMAE